MEILLTRVLNSIVKTVPSVTTLSCGLFSSMNSQFLDEASLVVTESQVLINMVSKRVRQLSAGSRAMVDIEGRMGLADIALAEIAQGKLVLAKSKDSEAAAE